ncbi:MAG: DEAD/DEAH box helicase [Dehalococcoidales bacterium]|nr:DEAD/DEAH box helicase [Dehalococcoidales bacterium]
MNFNDFNLHPCIMEGVNALGYTEPTPIQSKAIPVALQGNDIVGLAQTGTGKTAAFVLPILQKLMPGKRGQVRALIMSPTRELAEQTCTAINKLGKKTGIRSIAVYGGVSISQQVINLRNCAEIVVACPGRLLDHIWRGTVDLSHIEILVIDEADRMLDMGFLPNIKSILDCIMQKHQTLLFSATMPKEIRRLTEDILTQPLNIQIGETAPAETVSHALYPVKQHLKTALLMEILYQIQKESVIVFTRTKHRAEKVADELKKAGFKAASLHGNLSQIRRQSAIDGLRRGSIKVLVATDIASRGIDILSITHVINYDIPECADDYTHRIGRTGRINNNGDAWTLVTAADTGMIRDIEKILKSTIERKTIQGFDYTIAAPVGERVRYERKPARSDAQTSRQSAGRELRNKMFNNRRPAIAKAI